MRKLVLLATILLISTSLVFAQKNTNEKLEFPTEKLEVPSDSFGTSANDRQINLFSGFTSVRLSSDFVGALGALEIAPSRIFPGRIIGGTAVFPITSGNLEADNLRGEILHSGGLKLTKNDTTVKLQSFIIDTTGESIVLTGLVSANGTVVGRIPLFDLQLTNNLENWRVNLRRFRLNNVFITLRPEAANALNAVFETDAFVPGFSIGTGFVRGIAFID